MYLRPAFLRRRSRWTLAFVILVGIGAEPCKTESSIASLEDGKESLTRLAFLREFSGADDVTREEHPVLDRSLDIIAGPAEQRATQSNLVAPTGVATDSRHRVFVADEGAGIVACLRLRAIQIFSSWRPRRAVGSWNNDGITKRTQSGLTERCAVKRR